ncbi:MAG: hypothetical protein QOI54_2828 [Actinomycetota bacterium]|jgi:hypothetical protein|nr:hypothetical protein [Actinomycetota bacterium]
MAERDEPTDIDKLLAEVDGMLGDRAPARPAARAPAARAASDADEPAGVVRRVRAAAVSGALAAGVVWVAFALLPFLRATSGAAGAFLAAFVAVLVLRRR